ncbi:hypothetical protein PM3016_6232 [Paenibacillus mucilaginosus 3016]|uniref:Uncharacterized protein n=1 Tax=Paenibacillus mucilaginosus 3016 TaxID=1116391 RepID=H6NBC2_9BACL|nr:hypothetical protein [Paenibacillus mucilaginosus]AFC32868.1 hypothetical protein PM3016_6232 [Paenibacillus mucilaginosus 3016]WFA21322.1 hypothetical protein ERY13_30955 [Paenibacillus mucilaginosus]
MMMDYVKLGNNLLHLHAIYSDEETGIRDENREETESLEFETKEKLHSLSVEEQRFFLSRLCRDEFLSETALEKGYGIEDVVVFLRWLDDNMGIYY